MPAGNFHLRKETSEQAFDTLPPITVGSGTFSLTLDPYKGDPSISREFVN